MEVLKVLSITLLAFLSVTACDPTEEIVNTQYKDEMRSLVGELSQYAKELHPGFIVIPQNGPELLTVDGNPDSRIASEYISAIDGVGREDLFYGYNRDNAATPERETERMLDYLSVCPDNSLTVLVTDYCSSGDKIDDSYTRNKACDFISFAAPDRELRVIPEYPAEPYGLNQASVTNLSLARNFLYLINPENYATREAFISAIENTSYDLVLIDAFSVDNELYSPEDINRLRVKKDGGDRLIIAYLSIGEAENYRYYWQTEWNNTLPDWITEENPDWEGNYKVKYWHETWQSILFGSDSSYLDKILASGFDGVYLDIVDAFEYFEGLGY